MPDSSAGTLFPQVVMTKLCFLQNPFLIFNNVSIRIGHISAMKGN